MTPVESAWRRDANVPQHHLRSHAHIWVRVASSGAECAARQLYVRADALGRAGWNPHMCCSRGADMDQSETGTRAASAQVTRPIKPKFPPINSIIGN